METTQSEKADCLELKDKIDGLLLKTHAITSCLLAMNDSNSTLCKKYWHGALWAIDDFLDELEKSISKLDQLEKSQ